MHQYTFVIGEAHRVEHILEKLTRGVRPMEGVIFERWARLNYLRSMEGVVLDV
jgi:hypothetical protein